MSSLRRGKLTTQWALMFGGKDWWIAVRLDPLRMSVVAVVVVVAGNLPRH